MKISVALQIYNRGTVLGPLLQDNLGENLRRLAAFGYEAIELSIADPLAVDAEEVASLCQQHNLEIVAVDTGHLHVDEGLSLTDPDPAMRERALQRLLPFMDLAAAWGSWVIVGLLRGSEKGPAVESILVQSLKKCSEEAKMRQVGILFEPLNRYETSLVNTTPAAIDVIKKVGKPNVGLLLDTFHMNIEDASLGNAIREAAPYLRHVHVADSNRRAPGWGHIDFTEVLTALTDIDYGRGTRPARPYRHKEV
jgi:sugar phosphate isomerase/epimerase